MCYVSFKEILLFSCFFRKLLPDLARSLVQTAIDPVFRPKNAKGRGDNWFSKI